MTRRSLLVPSILAVTLLGGCTTVDTEPGIDLQISPDSVVVPVVATFAMVDATIAISDTAVELAQIDPSVREPIPGIYLTEPVVFDDAGRARVTLPSASEVAASTLAAPERAFEWAVAEAEDCVVAASDPEARMSYLFGGGSFLIPGNTASTLLGDLPVLVSEAPITVEELEANTYSFVSWIYADGAVDVALEGTDCADLTVAIELSEGWNAVRWSIDVDMATADVIEIDAPLFLSSPSVFIGSAP